MSVEQIPSARMVRLWHDALRDAERYASGRAPKREYLASARALIGAISELEEALASAREESVR